jgi:type VI secretion system protein VasG
MTSINLKSLINKLNESCKKTLEAAAGMCLTRTNYNVEVEHWLLKFTEDSNNDIMLILNHYGVNLDLFTRDLLSSLDRLKMGNNRTPAISQNIVDWCREAWLVTSLEFEATHTRSSHLLIALLQDDMLSRLVRGISQQFDKISLDNLRDQLLQITSTSCEAEKINQTFQSSDQAQQNNTQKKALNQFTINLTEQAKQGKIDPVIGRDAEIRQIIDILMRRRQNNPILTGEAGVGKTAVVEGFALRVVLGDVPPCLQNITVCRLDLGLLQAGAGIKGEFENRLKSVINELKSSVAPIILFIDEAHTLIGAGGSAGQGDAANLLKPELARGELRIIAATTWSEYKKYFEQDAALVRRFEVVKINEPSESLAKTMLQGMVATLEKHHNVRILDTAINEAVILSQRYLAGRQLPDKAVSLLDTACARVAISQNATPAAIEHCQHQLSQLAVEKNILLREINIGIEHHEKLVEIELQHQQLSTELNCLTQQWKQEQNLILDIKAIHQKLESNESNLLDDQQALRHQIVVKTKELETIQGEHPLVQLWVKEQTVAEVIGDWTGIPVGRMVSDEINTILHLKETLKQRVIGQDHALQAINQSIETSRAKLTDPRKPIGVFLFAGTSGVGKTETAMVLAEQLYGSHQNLTVINMTEFKEEFKVSTLVGAPPGYVGYGQGGVLTEAVRRRPYSLILLDEIEKAHPSVQDIFFQVFDKGVLRDSEGRDVDFKNTVIIMTCNTGSSLISKLCADENKLPSVTELTAALELELSKTFKQAFLGRIQIVPFYPLNQETMKHIVVLQLSRIAERIKSNYKAEFNYTADVLDHIIDRCNQSETGARTIEHLLNGSLLPELSTYFLSAMAENREIERVQVSIKEKNFDYQIDYCQNLNEILQHEANTIMTSELEI